jgi:galactoside O-acetyltransferase
VLLPGTIIADGAAIGSLSLVQGTLSGNSIYVGVPAKKIRSRQTGMYGFEKRLNAGD